MANDLRGRVAAQRPGAQAGAAVARTAPATGNTLVDKVRAMESEFQLAMPRGAEATQLIRDAITAVRTTKNLEKCEANSVLGGLMTCAQLGLRPGVLGHAWLLPFWSSKANDGRGGHVAQLVIGYQGLVELAYRSDRIVSISARTVYTNDEFRLAYGLDGDDFVHTPTLTGRRGDPRLFYAIARMKGGGYALTDPMTVEEMEAYRDEHATAKDRTGKVFGPWVDNFEGMAHKTMIRRLSKLLPKSTELAQALEADERVRVDLSPHVDPATTGEYIDGEVINEATGEVTTDPPHGEGFPPDAHQDDTSAVSS